MLKVYAVTLAGVYAKGFMVVVAGDEAEVSRLALEENIGRFYEVDQVQELPLAIGGYLADMGDEAKGGVIFADFYEE